MRHRDPVGTGPDRPDWTSILGFWIPELDHRVEQADAVRRAAILLTEPGSAGPPGTSTSAGEATRGPRVERLICLDPLRDRPLLDEDPDGAVLVDILLTPLAAPPSEYTPAASRVDRAEVLWGGAQALPTVEHLLSRGSIYATPECRVRLEGRAHYNLAFDAARLRATRAGPPRN
jgi:hypothetical protein